MPDIIGSLGEFSKLIAQWVSAEVERLISRAVCNGIAESVQKSRERLFSMAVSIALVATGFFLTLWGISTAIDTFFAMRGLGYVLIGLLAALAGAVVYKK